MKKLSVCILFGGISPEHEVSLRSAESVLNNIDHNKYNVFPVGITKDGDWIYFGGKDYSMLLRRQGLLHAAHRCLEDPPRQPPGSHLSRPGPGPADL